MLYCPRVGGIQVELKHVTSHKDKNIKNKKQNSILYIRGKMVKYYPHSSHLKECAAE